MSDPCAMLAASAQAQGADGTAGFYVTGRPMAGLAALRGEFRPAAWARAGTSIPEDVMLIGFRIEFWENGKPAGGAWCEDAYQAVALPRPGDLVSSQIISGITPPRWLPVPFMTVTAVEHYPVKPPDRPGVQVVFRAEACGIALEELRPLEALGWTVELFPEKPG
jgi:hypothetical protein